MNELVRPIVEAAERDPNVVGVLLKGSQSIGAADEESDWDVVLVLLEGEPSQKKDGSLELITDDAQAREERLVVGAPGARALSCPAGQTG